MSDNLNVNTNPPRRRSLSEKISDMFSSIKGHRHSGQNQQSAQNQSQSSENPHDSAFAIEGSTAGAHAIPPVSLEHRYQDNQNKAQQPNSDQVQAQTHAQSQAPVQTLADQQQTSGSSHT
ncbi:hypothetical protein BGZ97_006082 [Linnemannia gamsii]|uniref:Uncharacterized protein n=1 Tax=Linnemannia gamsii TaxID=64522 RepID=A0A9P6UEV6_9FUNG|nr:hypothetical protein BGZ97_006082 [Linnemannia gamsii]